MVPVFVFPPKLTGNVVFPDAHILKATTALLGLANFIIFNFIANSTIILLLIKNGHWLCDLFLYT